jgi:hypothetical protein
MAINKLIKTKLERPALLVETVIDVDADYFIAEIDRILNIKNLDFVTNVKGRMTDWDAKKHYLRLMVNYQNILKVLLH